MPEREVPPGGLKQVAAMKKATLPPGPSSRVANMAKRVPKKEHSLRGAIQRRLNRGQK